MAKYIADCYGDQGERLVQLLSLEAQAQNAPFSSEAILLCGPTGVGKSFILDHFSKGSDCKIYRLTIGDLAAEFKGRLALGLERTIRKALAQQHAIVILEDLDLFFPLHADAQDVGLFPCLTRFTDTQRHSSTTRLLIVGTSRSPNNISLDAKALFQDTIHFGIPTPKERLAMLQYLFQSMNCSVDPTTLAMQAHAFTAANLAQWCRLAVNRALDEQLTLEHFRRTYSQVNLSTEGVMAEKPDPVTWDQIGGLAEAKRALEESAVWVYKYAAEYKRLGVLPCRGVLLHGPPGTGKTLLAKAVATESDAHFLPIRVPDLIKPEVGESEKALVQIFETAKRCQPSIIFLDEVEAIFSTREHGGDVSRKLISQLLVAMDQLPTQVMLLAATNHVNAIDPALLSPGRFDRLIHVDVPGTPERLAILQVLGSTFPLAPSVDLADVAQRTEGFTGADLKAVLRKSALLVFRRTGPPVIQPQDIDQALDYFKSK
ncbi:AAA-domain-containing protein [Hesseltinella vesiculosa]|uniref:AAA-domain-containing protein n=1 Tax=Hesseltinella vesiculosa TaxID=101127 RepID=A0A1X2GTN5_9FUNG|nr:AAA-domain-containing protein [Hesseltinella vesiculosa]